MLDTKYLPTFITEYFKGLQNKIESEVNDDEEIKEKTLIIDELKKIIVELEIKLQEKTTNNKPKWHSVKDVEGYKIGKLGSLSYALDEDLNPISEGFHEINVSNKLGVIGAMTYKLNNDFDIIGEGFHEIDVINKLGIIGAMKYKLDDDFNIISQGFHEININKKTASLGSEKFRLDDNYQIK